MLRSFILSVDRASITLENLGTYSISLNVTDDHEEDPVSVFFTFSLEVKEPEPEEEIEEEVVEEKE